MSKEVKVPKLGDNVAAAEIIALLVAVGDTVSEGQGLIELESDKASVEVPSPAAGIVESLAVAQGDRVAEGQLILTLSATAVTKSDSQDTDVAKKPTATPAQTGAKAATASESEEAGHGDTPDESGAAVDQPEVQLKVQVPKLGDNVDRAEVIAVLVAAGDSVAEGQSLIELESDKASVEVPSPAAGVVESVAIAVGDQAQPEQVILTLKIAGDSQAPASAKTVGPAVKSAVISGSKPDPQSGGQAYESNQQPELLQPDTRPSTQRVAAAPSVRRFARELGADIQAVPGTGPRGRISVEDVKRYIKSRLQVSPEASASSLTQNPPDLPDFSAFGPVSTEKMSPVRRATARQMHLAWSQIPHVTQFDQADITAVEIFRKQYGKPVEKAGGKLTVTSVLLKLCALALKRFPQFNASVDVKNEQIIFKQHYHIGVAVDTPRGLLVPVLRDVDQKGLIDLSVEMGQLAAKARDRKTSPEDLQGGTFTISNLGGLGTTYFTPIVNWPQVAILGVGRASQQPVWRDGAFEPRLIMPLSVSYDHRLIDGADAARFLRWIAEALENPLLLLMEGDL